MPVRSFVNCGRSPLSPLSSASVAATETRLSRAPTNRRTSWVSTSGTSETSEPALAPRARSTPSEIVTRAPKRAGRSVQRLIAVDEPDRSRESGPDRGLRLLVRHPADRNARERDARLDQHRRSRIPTQGGGESCNDQDREGQTADQRSRIVLTAAALTKVPCKRRGARRSGAPPD